MTVNLFDKAGRYSAPDAATFAALSEPERVAINRIGDAAAVLDAANNAVRENESALTDIRAEIKKLEKSVPKVTFNDLAKQMAADTMRRRAGL